MRTLDQHTAREILAHNVVGRLGCYSRERDQVYVVPITYRLQGDTVYFGCLPGQKLDFLRTHPGGVCLEVDEVVDAQDWVSVVVTGRFEELKGMEYLVELPSAIRRAGQGALREGYLEESPAGHRLTLCALRIERISARADSWLWDRLSLPTVPQETPA